MKNGGIATYPAIREVTYGLRSMLLFFDFCIDSICLSFDKKENHVLLLENVRIFV